MDIAVLVGSPKPASRTLHIAAEPAARLGGWLAGPPTVPVMSGGDRSHALVPEAHPRHGASNWALLPTASLFVDVSVAELPAEQMTARLRGNAHALTAPGFAAGCGEAVA